MISREFLDAHRRRRFILAAAEIAHEFGRRGVTTTTLCQLAHTARNTFYENFGCVEECLCQGVELAYTELFGAIVEIGAGEEWAGAFEHEVASLYHRIASEPLLAELLLIHSFSLKGAFTTSAYERAVDSVAALLGPGRVLGARLGHEAPAIAEEAGARMIVDLAARALLGGVAHRLPEEAETTALLAAGGLIGFGEAERQIGRAKLATGARM
jgi:AcrR family transcriptional regulator